MKTAAHSTYTGPGRIVISLGSPRGAPAGYRIYKKLAPTRDMLRRGYGREEFFEKILGPLDPRATWDELHRLAGGAEPVLQCFERPPFTAQHWCHRRMVADWFLERLGEQVDELTPESTAQREQHQADRSAARAAQDPLRRAAANVSDAAWAIRAEIETFWLRLGIRMTWSWSGLPDRVRAELTERQIDQWDDLQVRYREVY